MREDEDPSDALAPGRTRADGIDIIEARLPWDLARKVKALTVPDDAAAVDDPGQPAEGLAE